jgi:hypothetical protein
MAGIKFADATKVERLDSHAYRVDLDKSFCIGAGTLTHVFYPIDAFAAD